MEIELDDSIIDLGTNGSQNTFLKGRKFGYLQVMLRLEDTDVNRAMATNCAYKLSKKPGIEYQGHQVACLLTRLMLSSSTHSSLAA